MTSTQQVSKKSIEELEALKKEKSGKCNVLKKNVAGIVTKNMHSPMFIVYAALLSIYTVIAVIGAVTSISDSWITSLISLLFTIPAIVSVVCAWKLYASKETVTADKMKGLRSFVAFAQVISVLIMIIVCILAVILVIGGNLLANMAGGLGDSLGGLSDALTSIGQAGVEGGEELGDIASGASDAVNTVSTTFRIIIFVVAALLVFIFGNVVSTFSKDKKHFKFIEDAVTSGSYNVNVKVPKVRSFIYGSVIAVMGCMMFTVSVFSALQIVCLGGYVFVTALVFMNIHNGACQNQRELSAAEAELAEIEEEINEARREAEAAEKEEAKKAKAEREKQEAQQQAQQQMMMQMMMAQMMKNNEADTNAQKSSEQGSEQKDNKK